MTTLFRIGNDKVSVDFLNLTTLREESETDPRREGPHAVVLHNDDINGFDYVVGVLQKVFGYGPFKAFGLTLKAHITGRSVVWTGLRKEAEAKAGQVRACGPDPQKKAQGAQPLTVTVEPLPDG